MDMPIVKLTVEGMKHSILHAFLSHSAEIAEEVERQLGEFLGDFDVSLVIRNEIRRVVPNLLRSKVETLVSDVMYQPEIAEYIKAAIVKRVSESPNE